MHSKHAKCKYSVYTLEHWMLSYFDIMACEQIYYSTQAIFTDVRVQILIMPHMRKTQIPTVIMNKQYAKARSNIYTYIHAYIHTCKILYT